MTKWLIIYKKKNEDKCYKFCYANNQQAVVIAIEKLYSTTNNIETIQIKKVVV